MGNTGPSVACVVPVRYFTRDGVRRGSTSARAVVPPPAAFHYLSVSLSDQPFGYSVHDRPSRSRKPNGHACAVNRTRGKPNGNQLAQSVNGDIGTRQREGLRGPPRMRTPRCHRYASRPHAASARIPRESRATALSRAIDGVFARVFPHSRRMTTVAYLVECTRSYVPRTQL